MFNKLWNYWIHNKYNGAGTGEMTSWQNNKEADHL